MHKYVPLVYYVLNTKLFSHGWVLRYNAPRHPCSFFGRHSLEKVKMKIVIVFWGAPHLIADEKGCKKPWLLCRMLPALLLLHLLIIGGSHGQVVCKFLFLTYLMIYTGHLRLWCQKKKKEFSLSDQRKVKSLQILLSSYWKFKPENLFCNKAWKILVYIRICDKKASMRDSPKPKSSINQYSHVMS